MRFAIWYHLYNLLKLTLLHGCFSRFLNFTNVTKSRNAPLIIKAIFVYKNDSTRLNCSCSVLKYLRCDH